MNKVIILIGQRVRSGTNFVGTTLKMHPDLVTLPNDTSLGEFNVFKNENCIEVAYNEVADQSFGLNFNNDDKELFFLNYGQLWMNVLIKKFNIPESKVIFMKTCSSEAIDLWLKTFPNSKIALIIRDGRDNVISSVKASNDKRNWHNLSVKLKKIINYYSGRSFINHTKDWGKTMSNILEWQNSKNVCLFRYEDLNNNEKGIKELLEFYELNVTPEIINACLQAPVVGSSYGIHTASESKPNWEPDFDKSKYVFSNKWGHWGLMKKMIFKKIAGKQLIQVGYEQSRQW